MISPFFIGKIVQTDGGWCSELFRTLNTLVY